MKCIKEVLRDLKERNIEVRRVRTPYIERLLKPEVLKYFPKADQNQLKILKDFPVNKIKKERGLGSVALRSRIEIVKGPMFYVLLEMAYTECFPEKSLKGMVGRALSPVLTLLHEMGHILYRGTGYFNRFNRKNPLTKLLYELEANNRIVNYLKEIGAPEKLITLYKTDCRWGVESHFIYRQQQLNNQKFGDKDKYNQILSKISEFLALGSGVTVSGDTIADLPEVLKIETLLK